MCKIKIKNEEKTMEIIKIKRVGIG